MININGKVFYGKSITISNGTVIVDGEVVENNTQGLTIKITGSVDHISCDESLSVIGDIKGDVHCQASVNCDKVSGDVFAKGSVNCDNVGGNVEAGGSVVCDKVKGNVTAGGNVIKG